MLLYGFELVYRSRVYIRKREYLTAKSCFEVQRSLDTLLCSSYDNTLSSCSTKHNYAGVPCTKLNSKRASAGIPYAIYNILELDILSLLFTLDIIMYKFATQKVPVLLIA